MINRLVLENLRHRPMRTALSILAVGLEVTMMLTLVGISRGMLEDMARRARGVGADIWIRPGGAAVISFSSASIPQKILGFLEEQPHVEIATGNLVYPIGGVDSVTGIDLEKFSSMSGGFKYLAGRAIRYSNEIVVDEYFARQKDLKAGSTLRVMNRDWRVAGIVEPGKLARLILPLGILQELTANTGKLTQVFVKLDDPDNLPAVIASLKEKLPGYQIYSVEQLTSLFSVSNVPGLRAFIGVIIGLAVVVGFLVVFLSMYTAVLERTREIGILKALGASPAYVLHIVVRETALVAVVGSVLGVGLSYVTRWLVAALVPASLVQEIVPGWWPIAAGIALAGALLGSAYPGWRAARQDPIEALAYE